VTESRYNDTRSFTLKDSVVSCRQCSFCSSVHDSATSFKLSRTCRHKEEIVSCAPSWHRKEMLYPVRPAYITPTAATHSTVLLEN